MYLQTYEYSESFSTSNIGSSFHLSFPCQVIVMILSISWIVQYILQNLLEMQHIMPSPETYERF